MSCKKNKKNHCSSFSDEIEKKIKNENTCCACGEVGCDCGVGICYFRLISCDSLKDKMSKDSKLVVINVLDKNFYDDCHILNSINIPFNEIENKVKSWDKNKEIIIYCANKDCPASKKAYKVFLNLGFKNLFLFEGGIKEWYKKGLLSEGLCKMDYLK